MSNEEKSTKVNGTWNGKPVSIKRVWGGHEFTEDELTKLFNDEIIEFEAISKKGTKYTVKGKLDVQTYEGNEFIGFNRIINEVEMFSGKWHNKDVKVKRNWSTHRFTDEEVEKLLNDETIEFETKSNKTGNTYTARGKLEDQEYEGNKYVGFKLIINDAN